MHVAHFHAPRLLVRPLAAALLAILLMLAVATAADRSLVWPTTPTATRATVASSQAAPPAERGRLQALTRWAGNPFSPTLGPPVALPWSAPRRG